MPGVRSFVRKWRSLRESNSSFQIENLTSLDRRKPMGVFADSKPTTSCRALKAALAARASRHAQRLGLCRRDERRIAVTTKQRRRAESAPQ
jgi:hypothetical protein